MEHSKYSFPNLMYLFENLEDKQKNTIFADE